MLPQRPRIQIEASVESGFVVTCWNDAIGRALGTNRLTLCVNKLIELAIPRGAIPCQQMAACWPVPAPGKP